MVQRYTARSMSETIAAAAEHEVVIQRSRFLALAWPVHDPAAALATIEDHRLAEASHNCWAYRVGNDYRFNDDGEPGGSAGRPILAAIDGQGLDQVVVLVARWFGGTKLGVGGLVRAYGGCAAECLRLAPRRALIDYLPLTCRFGFALEQPVRKVLGDMDATIEASDYRPEGLQLSLKVPADRLDMLRVALIDLCRGQIELAEPSTGATAATTPE